MPEFQVIKRGEIPNAWKVGQRIEPAKVRLHRGGCLYFSVLAAAIMGTEDCRVLAEFNKQTRTLKFTVVGDVLPYGVSENDCFPFRIRVGPNNRRPIGMVSIKALLRHVGFWQSGPVDFTIVAIDEKNRSVTVALP